MRALEINPKHVRALEYQGELFLQLGKVADAKLNLEKINGFSSRKNGKIKCYVTDAPSLFDDIASSFCLKKTEQAIQIDL